MSNPEQNVPLDLMIRRLEEANARAHQRVAHPDERVSESQQDVARGPSDQQKPSTVLDRQPSLGRPALLALIVLPLAASACVATFAWQSSYGDTAKLIVARWANAPLSQPAPLAPTTSQDVPEAARMSPELAQQLQTMTRDLANVVQGIEQLKAALSQMTRDSAAVAEQLKVALSQMTRDNAAVVEQLKASQEQMVRLTAPRARRKPVPTLPQDGEAVILER